MIRRDFTALLRIINSTITIIVITATLSFAQEKPRIGAWVRTEELQKGDIDLSNCEIVIDKEEHTAVQQAGRFLATDIGKISGYIPPVVGEGHSGKTQIHLVTLGNVTVPKAVQEKKLQGKWESYQIVTGKTDVWLVGSDFRGTAFACYTLSERLGIDPLYLWTNYRPEKHSPLILQKTSWLVDSPVFKYRGFFHDDEDILPRPFNEIDLPIWTGDVAMEWYDRYFETALRLRMNMVAPYTRVHRRYEIQKRASDWGLFYTSHHYDILLSNPWGFERFNLAKERGVTSQWDWYGNKENMITFWRGGVSENKDLDAIWPVGLRGTDDRSYHFPDDTSLKEQTAVYSEAIKRQVGLVKDMIPEDKMPLFHFTLYTEMLDKFRQDREGFDLPEDVMIIWPDDNNGIMRALPQGRGKWKHGVYYHLAYLGPQNITKQITHITSPQRITEQFANIVNAGATEYVLTNVSEMREYLMEARLIAEIGWGDSGTLEAPDPAKEYIQWWAAEYFGPEAKDLAAQAYEKYYELFDKPTALWRGSEAVQDLLHRLYARFNENKEVELPEKATIDALAARNKSFEEFAVLIDNAAAKMAPQQKQYFFEQIKLGLAIDWFPTQAALKLVEALNASDKESALKIVAESMEPLATLEAEILKAERPPFNDWYRKTWARRDFSPNNIHRAYSQVRRFYYSGGTVIVNTREYGSSH